MQIRIADRIRRSAQLGCTEQVHAALDWELINHLINTFMPSDSHGDPIAAALTVELEDK